MNKFYPLTPSIGKKLRDSNLTAAEWRLWSYLSELDPFGDRYTKLPDLLTIMQEVGIKKTTFYKAIATFQKEGLFDFQSHGFDFRNLAGVSSFVRPENTRKVFRKRGNSVRDRGTDFAPPENRSPDSAQGANPNSSQTLSDFTDYSYSPISPLNGEKEGEGASPPPLEPHPPKKEDGTRKSGTNPRAMGTNPRAQGTNPIAMETNPRNKVSTIATSESQDNTSPACNTVVVSDGARMEERMRSQTSHKPSEDKRVKSASKELPDGEWKDAKGNLKVGFMEYAIATYKAIFPDKQSLEKDVLWLLVVRYFRNDETRLLDFWHGYLSNSAYRMDNAVTRVQHGLTLGELEKQSLGQKFVEVADADVTDLPSSLPNRALIDNQLAPPLCNDRASVATFSATDDAKLPVLNDSFTSPATDITENSNAYKPWQPATSKSEATNDDWAKLRSRMSGIFKPMPKEKAGGRRQEAEGGRSAEGCMEEGLESKRQPNPLPSALCPLPFLELLQADLADSACRYDSDVQARAKRFVETRNFASLHSKYEAEYDSNGFICAIEMRF